VLASITQPCAPLLAASAAPPHSPALQPAGGPTDKSGTGSTHTPQAPSTQHLHVASAVLACGRSFAADALAATAPELLVFLVKHCAAARSLGMTTLMRGYHGRPGAVAAASGGEEGHHQKGGGAGGEEDVLDELGALDPVDSALEWFGSGLWGASDGEVASGSLLVGEDSLSAEDRRMPLGGLSRAGSAQPGVGHTSMAVALTGALTAPLPPPRWVDVALDRRLALLLALMARCALDPDAFAR
jgi:hypothetical protein